MRRVLFVVLALALLGAAAFWLLSAPETLSEADLPAHDADLENGRYVFFAAGCASCHTTPDQDDPFLLGGGLALTTSFGTFRAPNVSPHEQAGIGGWSTLDFVNAVMRGVSPEGRHYYPSFPYASYQRMAIEDVIDLKGFIDSLEPVESVSGAHELRFPYTVRRGIGLWKLLYVDGEPFTSDPDLDETENRGAYLVTGPAHCGECHTPRNAFGGMDRSRWLAGAPAPDADGRIPNITPHPDGIGDWSESDIAYSLETGFTPEFDSFGGAMARVVDNTSQLTDEDRQAIASYLKTVQPLPRSQ